MVPLPGMTLAQTQAPWSVIERKERILAGRDQLGARRQRGVREMVPE